MAAPPRSSDGHESPATSYTRPGTLYGRSATVYGRTVTDSDLPSTTDRETSDELSDESGFLGFTGVSDTSSGRHFASGEEPERWSGTTPAGLPAVALGLAVLALLIGGVATVAGVVAVGRASTAQVAAERAASEAASAAADARAAPTSGASQQAVVPAPASAPPSAPAAGSTLDPDRLDPRSNYELAYTEQLVRAQPSSCEGTDVDLDEPRVLPPTGADAAYRNCADGFHLDFDESSRFAVVTDPQASAGECANAIRADPGVGWVSPTPGTTVCVLTSRLAAEPQGLSTKLVRLHVQTVEADGTLAAQLTAWVVP
ncbi:hypothetical protein [Cryptosporangium minutisporangium]